MFLQAALGGYFLAEGSVTQLIDEPVFYEPGFNILSPLEIDSSKADTIYILIRYRDTNLGNTFASMDPNQMVVSVTDATNGESVVTMTESNTINDEWNDDNPSMPHVPILLKIDSQLDIFNPILRVRVIDCLIKYAPTDDFISFRIIVSDDSQYFHYIPVHRKSLSDRNTFSIAGREAYIKLNGTSDAYILISPYAWLKETDNKNIASFSYPQDSIHYLRQDTYNKEDFTFSLGAYHKSFIPEQISIMNIPGYSKACIVLIDNMLYSHLLKQNKGEYATVHIIGEASGIVDNFRINFHL